MITKNQNHERNQLEAISIEDLVSKNHLVRKLDAAIDYNFIYPLVEHLYSDVGRPSINPDAKEKHGMSWTTLRGLKKVSMEAMLIYSAMNLKKLANWIWKSSQINEISC